MKVVSVGYLLVCDEKFTIFRDYAVCFDKKIIEIGEKKKLFEKYKNAKKIEFSDEYLLMPSLINPHVHLEFSANDTHLHYGDFIDWLKSVVRYRDLLKEKCQEECYERAVKEMLKSGVGSFGEISSFGEDIKACKNALQKVVFFNEILGTRPDMVDALYQDFKLRLKESEELADERFIPAVSVHSPYSIHPILAKKVLGMARERGFLVSTHFMESFAEREWIDKGEGDFRRFFENFLPNSRPLTDSLSYIKLFEGIKTLFTHCCYATKKELSLIKEIGSVTHCPVSNRLLGNALLDTDLLEDIGCEWNIATDGLSSNLSLNMWDELRSALLMHHDKDLREMAKRLILGATFYASKALGLNNGWLESGKDADFIIISLGKEIEDGQLAVQTILHTKEVEKIYIDGEEA